MPDIDGDNSKKPAVDWQWWKMFLKMSDNGIDTDSDLYRK